MENDNKKLLIKKMLYRSVHRGCKETDILLGEFAKAKIDQLNDEDLIIYQYFIEEDDLEIYDWILAKMPMPAKYKYLVEQISKFHKLGY
jgi:antitoxin CptB